MKQLTYKQLEASREARLWIGQVIVPAIGLLAIPEVRAKIKDVAHNAKEKILNKKTEA